MLGKPSWFARRKYTGWGFSPKTWQGWVYLALIILPIVIVANLLPKSQGATIFLIIWAVIFALDFVHIALNLKLDEREKVHEAIAERNALWIIILVLAVGIAYQTAASVAAKTSVVIDPVILIALGAGLVAKIISNLYLDRRD